MHHQPSASLRAVQQVGGGVVGEGLTVQVVKASAFKYNLRQNFHCGFAFKRLNCSAIYISPNISSRPFDKVFCAKYVNGVAKRDFFFDVLC